MKQTPPNSLNTLPLSPKLILQQLRNMGNESHHHQQFKHRHHHPKSTIFLPILCSRPSIKDVALPRCRGNSSSSSSSPSCNDPLSPRIGCMGQVKRNNKISGFPISTSQQYNRLITSFSNKTNATTIPSPVVKYSKLKSLFSSKNLAITTPSTTNNISSSSCRTKQRVTRSYQKGVNSNRNKRSVENAVDAINMEAMDPPLPVVKRVLKLEEGDNSLWRRRSGGPTIKSLQLQRIQHPKICPQPTTV